MANPRAPVIAAHLPTGIIALLIDVFMIHLQTEASGCTADQLDGTVEPGRQATILLLLMAFSSRNSVTVVTKRIHRLSA
ncbi:hypothetical protein SBBP2_2880005 [Burkholderiales bacterium]|nr:hypothetical protein SBBP2_2880005 [Burkholderiales bacterium]